MATEIQTLIFPKEFWDSEAAVKDWLRKHDFKTELDETETSYRARQRDPGEFQEDSFRTICLDETKSGCRISAVIGRKKLAKYFTKRIDFQQLGYEKVPDVELLKTGSIGDIYLDSEDLNKLINNFEKLADHGDYPTVFIGHDKVVEKPVIGFVDNLRVENNTLYGDLYIDKHKLDVLREYPKRSCELWINGEEVYLDGVALLGSSPPRFNLGMLLYASRRCKCSSNARETGDSQMEDKLLELEKLIFELQEKVTELAKKLEEVEHAVLDVPQKHNESKPEEPKADDELVAALQTELAAERQLRRSLERRLVLDRLSQEYELNVEEELHRTHDFNDDQFSRYVEAIRKNYKKVSASRVPFLANLSVSDDDLERRAHEIAFARGSEQAARGIRVDYRKLYEEALNELKGVVK